MVLVYKQLFKQIVKDKVFLFLLFLLTVLTTASYFFGMFSIDGNMVLLKALGELTTNQQLYQNALESNTRLTYSFYASLTGLSAFVFMMFFYRFFRENKKQIGCIKALGYQDDYIQLFFVLFTAILSFLGSLFGVFGGYFISDILINANTQTYAVSGLVKGIGFFHLIFGMIASTIVFCMVAFLCYGFVRNKEDGILLVGVSQQSGFSITLIIADKICKLLPKEKRLPLRIALRKPISVVLLFVAVMSFQVCVLLGQSLIILMIF